MRTRRRAFTLIELIVVVALIALIAGVLIPAAISRAQLTELRAPSQRITQAPPSVVAHQDGERRIDPRVLDAEVDIRLVAEPVLDGLRVENRYRALFRGSFVVENVDPTADRLSVSFPFPAGTTEARDVSLSIQPGGRRFRRNDLGPGHPPDGTFDEDPAVRRIREESALREPTGVHYSAAGVAWTGAAPTGPLTFVVTYETAGRDAFSYDVLGGGRTDRIDVEVTLENAPEIDIPADSLTPTEIRSDTIAWRLEHAVGSRPIVIELPAGSSALGKLILLFQLSALGVLLFGAGFWYLSEGRKPGRLDGFRWGHFLLLALNYSLFFVVFGVIVYGGAPLVATLAASLISLPLLVLHVARVLDLRFALRSVLPLAAYSLATVTGAVYLPQHRALVLLGAAILAIAYVTATYRGFVSRRKAAKAAALARSKEEALECAPIGFDLERAAVIDARSPEEVIAARFALESAVQKARVDLKEALGKLESSIDSAAVLLEAPITGDAAVAEAAKTTRRVLAEVLEEARRIRREAASGAPKETSARASRMSSAIGLHRESLASALAALSRSHAHGTSHCSACGSSSDPASAFCPDCGTPRPHAVDCTSCGATFRVPVQIVKKKWQGEPIHCERCGHGLVAST